MPLLEFSCELGHVTEKLFRTFEAAEGVQSVLCPQCSLAATLAPSVPFPAMFYGDPRGYHKPSPANRYSTKLVSSKTGNQHSAG